ncbi:MAG: hypothetical protein QM734_02245 [Cyclobacteriaceae bacterium]
MKRLSLIAIVFTASGLYAQTTPNRMTVTIDGKVYNSEPRKIQYGQSVWISGNTVSPDKSLRIGIGNWAFTGSLHSGKISCV